jgi:uncharacterized protein YdeI (YjbR/CyaY-like superfamily)
VLMMLQTAKSTWTRLNRQRVTDLEKDGLMTESGLESVAIAQANGWWTILDPVEDLLEPDELRDALDRVPAARCNWDEFPNSAKKAMLWWVISAMKPDTRSARVTAIVSKAESNERAKV